LIASRHLPATVPAPFQEPLRKDWIAGSLGFAVAAGVAYALSLFG
jgi:hypothetical protein